MKRLIAFFALAFLFFGSLGILYWPLLAHAAAPMARPDLDNRPQKPLRNEQTAEPCNVPLPKGTVYLVIRLPDGRTVIIDAATIPRKC